MIAKAQKKKKWDVDIIKHKLLWISRTNLNMDIAYLQ